MKPRTTLAVAAVALTGLTLGLASPASAANTITTFEVTAGVLTLSVPESATWSTVFATGTESISGSLGAVSVTDARGGTAAWTVSAVSTTFTGLLTSPSSSTAVSYTAGVVTETGTITVADGAATVITTAAASVVAPTALSGNNTASWTPMLAVTMPASAKADTYGGTVTTSIL